MTVSSTARCNADRTCFPATAERQASQLGLCARLCAQGGYWDDQMSELSDDEDDEDEETFGRWPPPTADHFATLAMLLLQVTSVAHSFTLCRAS